MIDFQYKSFYDVDDLRRLVSVLRGEGGCPWDREQTHESIRRCMLEEAYEAAEAIDEKSTDHLREELGDVLLQVMFHSDIEADAGNFDLDQVADEECKKLILRHPHVFGDVQVSGADEVLKNWDDIKRKEKKQETVTSAMDSVAKCLPALWRAEKVQKKAAKVGFDWPDYHGALDKIKEELAETAEAAKTGVGTAEEIGDLLFSAVNAARLLGIDPEDALNASTDKFIARFKGLEELAEKRGLDMKAMTLEELDALYNEAKASLKMD